MGVRTGDGWVEGPSGERYWGRFGAAGLLLHDRERGILLQHRAHWSHFGGTWGIPGGARDEGEPAIDAALREAGEEAGVPAGVVDVRGTRVLDLGYWSYTTVIARTRRAFDPVVSDQESLELRWVPIAEVGDLDLHPRFAESWPELAAALAEG
ncbi:NUDIX hydrolase [Agromyces seonyuensis]|uniref:NUDIX domain-containing protein n=1 Tax=Agromyces seonyuensis TaxID=2662446 RepID=A0A6I4P4V0_9MICO|nr:NUDIX hydrolase [Agromyces seonyuensis]MWB98384.1 NUDIX domain-containing protein [Agromyces seonyuensis]